MTLNINTLKLDIQYLPVGASLSDGHREQVENQLALFMKESLARLTLTKLPSRFQVAQGDGIDSVLLEDMEIRLPPIDAQSFLAGRVSYFNQFVEPVLERVFYEALQIAANKAQLFNSQTYDVNKSDHQSDEKMSQDWWQDVQRLLHSNTGPLTFGHSVNSFHQQGRAVVPRLLKALKGSGHVREYFQNQLLNPFTFKRMHKWLRHSHEWQQLIVGFFSSAQGNDQDFNHNAVLSYMKQGSVSAAHRKRLLQQYLELNIVTQRHSNQQGQAVLDVYLKMRVCLDELDDQPTSDRFINDLHHCLLMDQGETWLKHCKNWLAVVLHQGLRPRDLEALSHLLKRAKGSSWRALDSHDKNTLLSNQVNSQLLGEAGLTQANGSQSLRLIYQGALDVLLPLNHFKGDMQALWWQLSSIKRFLQGPGKALNKDLQVKVQTALQALCESQAAQENALPYLIPCLKTRVDQILSELAQLLQSGQLPVLPHSIQALQIPKSSQFSQPHMGLLFSALNELALSPWLPISIKQQLDNIATLLTSQNLKNKNQKNGPLSRQESLTTCLEGVSQPLQEWLLYLPILFTGDSHEFGKHSAENNQVSTNSQGPSNPQGVLSNLIKEFKEISIHANQAGKNTALPSQSSVKTLAKPFTNKSALHNLLTKPEMPINDERALVMKIIAILAYHNGSAPLQQQAATFLQYENASQAIRLLTALQGVSEYSHGQIYPPSQEASDQLDEKKLDKKKLQAIQTTHGKGVYEHEQRLQGEILKVIQTLVTGVLAIDGDQGFAKQAMMKHTINKQQLYEILCQIIMCLQSVQSEPVYLKVKKPLQDLLRIKNQLSLLDQTLVLAKDAWWLPLMENHHKADQEAGGWEGHHSHEGPTLAKTLPENNITGLSDKTQQALISRLQICSLSLESHASVLDLTPNRQGSGAVEALITVILQVCEHLTDVNLKQILCEPIIKENAQSTASKRGDRSNIIKEINQWAATSLGFLQAIPQEQWAKLPTLPKKSASELMAFFKHCLQLLNRQTFQDSEVQNCQHSLQRLVVTPVAPNSSALAPDKIHNLIWNGNLLATQKLLKKQPIKNLPAKKSELLLNNHIQKVQSLIPKETLQRICQEISGELQQLNLASSQQDDNLLSQDGGLVLIWPYLKDFFNNNQLIEIQQDTWVFIDEASRATAHALLISILGCNQDDNVWAVANVLCGYPVDAWFDEPVELTAQQTSAADKLLKAVIHNWPALKDMPVASFRELFLLRPAILYENQHTWCIEVKTKTMDVLLTKLPWGLGYLSLPWLDKELIEVKWQYGF